METAMCKHGHQSPGTSRSAQNSAGPVAPVVPLNVSPQGPSPLVAPNRPLAKQAQEGEGGQAKAEWTSQTKSWRGSPRSREGVQSQQPLWSQC